MLWIKFGWYLPFGTDWISVCRCFGYTQPLMNYTVKIYYRLIKCHETYLFLYWNIAFYRNFDKEMLNTKSLVIISIYKQSHCPFYGFMTFSQISGISSRNWNGCAWCRDVTSGHELHKYLGTLVMDYGFRLRTCSVSKLQLECYSKKFNRVDVW